MALYDDADWLAHPAQSQKRNDRFASSGALQGGIQAASKIFLNRRSGERRSWTRGAIPEFWRDVIATWLLAAALLIALLIPPMPDKPAVTHAAKPPMASTSLPDVVPPLAADDETNPCTDPDHAHFRC